MKSKCQLFALIKKEPIEKSDYYVTIKYDHWSLYITILDVSTK